MDDHRLSCMEVWGGNEATDALVRTSGIDAHAFSLPYGGDANGGDVLHVTACSSGRITRALLGTVLVFLLDPPEGESRAYMAGYAVGFLLAALVVPFVLGAVAWQCSKPNPNRSLQLLQLYQRAPAVASPVCSAIPAASRSDCARVFAADACAGSRIGS